MTNNYCKKKNCGREIPKGERYCSFHKKMHKERNGNIIKAGTLLGSIALGLITKGKIGGGKS